jgi:hypothetical protein
MYSLLPYQCNSFLFFNYGYKQISIRHVLWRISLPHLFTSFSPQMFSTWAGKAAGRAQCALVGTTDCWHFGLYTRTSSLSSTSVRIHLSQCSTDIKPLHNFCLRITVAWRFIVQHCVTM